MAFNGSGTFVRIYNWVTDKINGVNITASRMDGEMDGFAAGLSNCLTRDGQGKMGTSFLPASDNLYSLGSTALRWAQINGLDTALMAVIGAHKASATSRTTTSLSDDPDLFLTLTAGVWRIEAGLFFNSVGVGGVTPGLKVGLHFIGACSDSRFLLAGSSNGSTISPSTIALSGTNQTQTVTLAAQAAPQVDTVTFSGSMTVTGSAQALLISWAQANSSGNASELLSNSYLTARRIG